MMLDDRAAPAEPSQIIADLRRERDEALAREAAIAEVLQVINSAPGDLAPVFQTILEKSLRLCEATHGTLRTFDGEAFHLAAAAHGEALALPGFRAGGPNSLLGRFIDGESIVHLADVLNSSEYELNPTVRQAMDAARARSWLGVSLRTEERLLGVISVVRQEVRPFSDEQVALLQSFAAQAVIAMENARLLTETRDALRQQTATTEVLQVINSSPGDLTPVFDAMLGKAHTLCGAAAGALLVFEGEQYRIAAVHGAADLASIWAPGTYLPMPPCDEDSPIPRLMRGERLIHLPDATDDPMYRAYERYRRLIDAAGSRTLLVVPLRKEDAVLGAITAFHQEVRPFSDDQIALLQNFAAQAVIAMENARLLGELQTRTRDLEESLKYQTATSDVLNVISRSTADVQPVLDTVVETAAGLCGADIATIAIREGEVYRYVASTFIAAEPEYWNALRQRTVVPSRDSMASRVLLEGRVAHVPDIRADPDHARPEAVAAGIRTALGVPLLREGVVLGTINLARKRVEPFTARQIELVRTFADQAVIAMENARLLTELQQRTRDLEESLKYQTATSDVLKVISRSTFDLQPVLDTLVATAARLCSADLGLVSSREADGLRVNATFSTTPEYEAFIRGHLLPLTRGSLAGRACAEGKAVQIPDLTADPEFTVTETVTLGKMRAALAVPLMREGEVIGAISLARQRVEPFTERQLELVATFADQAVIAIENTRLITETREALEQQTATAEVLQVINASPGDLEPVFDAMLEKALRLCDAAQGSLFTLADGALHLAATRATPQVVALRRQEGPHRPEPGTPLYSLITGERVVHFTDLRDSSSYRDFPAFRERVNAANARSLVAVALHKDETPIGVLDVFRQEVRPFSDEQIALLENFAAQAVIAMENARLLTETREALEQQTAMAEVLGVINSAPGDLVPVFEAVLEKALRLCDASFGSVYTRDGEHFERVVSRGMPAEYLAAVPSVTGSFSPGNFLARIIGGEGPISIPDLAEPEVIRLTPRFEPLVRIAGARSYVGVALRKDEQVLGFIAIYRREVRPFADKQIALLQNFAAQAVIAVENARLLGELRDRTGDLEEALGYQTATSDVLKVISRSAFDLQPVLTTLVETAARLCEADRGLITIKDGEVYRVVATFAVTPEFDVYLRSLKIVPNRGTVTGRIVLERQVVHIEDLANDPEYALPVSDFTQGAHTILGVPLMREGQPTGAIVLARHRVEPFAPRQIELVRTFSDQAVIAIENARLITETREALEQQTATAEVLQVINSSPGDLAPVFDAMVQKAMRLCGAAHGALRTFDGEALNLVAMHGDADLVARVRQTGPIRPQPGTPYEPLVRGERIVHIVDARDSIAYQEIATSRERVDVLGIRSFLAVALSKDGKLLGALSVFRREVRPFSEKEIALLENFAVQAVIAMENARLLGELRQRTEEVAQLNRGLEARVAEQVDELGRVGRLKRFLAPQLAELIVSQGDEKILESHRREIVVVFCDLRGYTAFTETAEPEEVLDFLREYHGALGPLVSQFEGTLDQFSGDGIMVFFNDPVPIADPAERAVNMAVAMRSAANTLIADWRERGRDLGFGAGIAQGYATLGQIGFSERSGYTAIGTVCNVAARLCAEAKDGQILLGQRVNVALKGRVATEQLGALALKGFTQPVVAYNVPLAATPQPALRVIEGGPQNV